MRVNSFAWTAMFSCMLLMSSAFTVRASENGSAELAAVSSVKKQIASVLNDVATSGEVKVIFKVSSGNGFELVNVTGDNNKLVTKVKNRLAKEKVEVPTELNGCYALKVKFYDEDSYAAEISPEVALRSAIVEALGKVDATDRDAVTVLFSVKDNALKVIRVLGEDKQFLSTVEKSINDVEVNDSGKLAGVYQIKVNFSGSF